MRPYGGIGALLAAAGASRPRQILWTVWGLERLRPRRARVAPARFSGLCGDWGVCGRGGRELPAFADFRMDSGGAITFAAEKARSFDFGDSAQEVIKENGA